MTERFTVSLEAELADAFDEYLRRLGSRNRSEAVRDLIREALAREQLEATAMGKLAEAGLGGLDRNAVAKMMGLPQDWSDTGADRARDVVTGFATIDAGKAITDQFTTQFVRQETRYVQVGVQMVEWVTKGAESGVPGIVDALLDALVPGLAERLGGRP